MSDYGFGTFLGALFFIILIIAITWVILRIQGWAIHVTARRPQRQRVASTPTDIQVGDPYEGADAADCPSVSADGWFCTEPEGHAGPHLASNGTKLVGKWL